MKERMLPFREFNIKPSPRRRPGSGFLAGLLLLAGSVLAADPVGQAIDATVQTNREAKASQQKIEQLDDQTRALVERYRNALFQAQQLGAYAEQLEKLSQGHEAQRASLQQQLAETDVTSRQILPLLSQMVDSLEKFITLDLPFLKIERSERLVSLKKLMADPSAPLAEKYRRVLEAYTIEAEYGRTLGAERAQVADVETDLLRVGRIALFALTLDGRGALRWDAPSGQWEELPGRYRKQVRLGLKIAREAAAPDFLTLPMPVPAGAKS